MNSMQETLERLNQHLCRTGVAIHDLAAVKAHRWPATFLAELELATFMLERLSRESAQSWMDVCGGGR